MSVANAIGRISLQGIKNGATWGTAVQVGANHGVFCNNPQLALPVERQFIEHPGRFGLRESIVTQHTPNPTLTFQVMRTGALWIPVACWFGSEATAAVSTDYNHTMTLLDEARKFFTLAQAQGNNSPLQSGDDMWEWPSLKPSVIEFSKGGNGLLQVSVETIGDTLYVEGDSGLTGDATDFNSLTYIATNLFIINEEPSIKINAQSAGDVTSGNNIEYSDYRIRLSRPMSPRMVNRGASTGVELQTVEPLQNEGYPEIIFGLNEDRYITLAELTDYGTQKKMQWLITKTVGSIQYDIEFLVPAMDKMGDASAELTDGNNIPYSNNWRALEVTSAPTGMTNTHVQLRVRDNFSTSYLSL